jgi:peptidoglycan/xylan/chitin deacetylase (PgdA/CDA1 family)
VARRRAIRPAMVLMATLVVLAVLTLCGPVQVQAATTITPGTECSRIPTKEKVIALTFDDAWIDADLESILATLKTAGIKATFFPTGIGVEQSPELARRVVAEGHEFGSHAYTHSKLRVMSRDELLSQIQKTEEAFSAAGLKDPAPLFRAPWGEVNAKVLSVLGDEGYVNIMWTARGGDTVAHRTPAQVIVNVMNSVRAGGIIVMHTRNEITPKALPELIRRIKAKGYRFVTLSEVLLSPEQRISRYQQTSPLLSYQGAWSKQESALESGGSVSCADSEGATVMASFTGTTLELLARTGPDCGKASVIIDGGTSQEVDFYSATERHRVSVFATGSLADGTHTVLISSSATKNAASAGYSINVDALRVAGALTLKASALVQDSGPTQAFAPRVYPVLTRGWDILRFSGLDTKVP